MKVGRWGVVGMVSVVCAVAGFGGCAPTELDDAIAESKEPLVQCGNGACEAGESCASCPGDCGRCTQAHCGDGMCGRKESCVTCAQDCGACPGCGNGVCDAMETCASCGKDCGRCGGEFCGNGVCARRESCTACSRDCCPTPPAECQDASECPETGEACVVATCVNGLCGTAPVEAGTPILMQTAGDCLETICDGTGSSTAVPDDADLPGDDGNECTADVCSMGVPSYPPAAEGTSCTDGACNASGSCVPSQCQNAADCPPRTHGCETAMCLSGTCSMLDSPTGAPSYDQVSGDCQQVICDGFGDSTSQPDDTDVPQDRQCSIGTCVMGSPSYTPVTAGTPCNAPFPALGICDGMGTCL